METERQKDHLNMSMAYLIRNGASDSAWKSIACIATDHHLLVYA